MTVRSATSPQTPTRGRRQPRSMSDSCAARYLVERLGIHDTNAKACNSWKVHMQAEGWGKRR